MKRIVIAMFCLSVLSGCTVHMAIPPILTPNGERVVVGRDDPAPGHVLIGGIQGVDGDRLGPGHQGTFEGAVIAIRNKAETMGANYVQIVSTVESGVCGTSSIDHVNGVPILNGCFRYEYTITGLAYKGDSK